MTRRGTVLITLFKTKVIPKCKRFIEASFDSKYLMYTNVFTSMASFAMGDVVEQRVESLIREYKKCDYVRTLRMTATGFVNGIFQHFWQIKTQQVEF